MFKLLKYEFIRSYKLFITVIVVTILANIGLSFFNNYSGIAFFITLMPIILIVIYIYTIIKSYSNDLNKKTGYMIFLTPQSGYSIIGSKLIYTLSISIVFIIIYFLFLLCNYIFIALCEGVNVSNLFTPNNITIKIEEINLFINLKYGLHIFDFIVTFICFILQQTVTVLTIYSSITIRKSIFSNTKHGGLFSFIIFILLNFIIIYSLVYIINIIQSNNINYIPLLNSTDLFSVSNSVKSTTLISVIYQAFLSILMFLGIGYLLENKINL